MSVFTKLRVNEPLVTPEQIRAARAWLCWSRNDLSERSGVSPGSIAMYEQGRSVPYDDTLAKLRAAFEAAGIRFHFVGMSGTGISRGFEREGGT
uniref:Helix-turn-helix domain protein n=1 Tax=Rhodopseudomonas palustris (strain DX-1) TaxID=652103 RepID=E6VQ06_RHOPX